VTEIGAEDFEHVFGVIDQQDMDPGEISVDRLQ
jgi:hypothetical protein